MTPPNSDDLFAALDATWPAKSCCETGGWLLREGGGGGKRVSATSPLRPDADIAHAEAEMRHRGQSPLFRLGVGDAATDAQLAGQGYRLLDPTLIYLSPVGKLARKPGAVSLFHLWPPLAIMRDIWAEGGIGPARLAVMTRAQGAKTGLIARIDDRAAGVGFCALHQKLAMLHAVEVLPFHRRKGVGELILRGAAHWAQSEGAQWLALAVTETNSPARSLYARLGMEIAARYHYREIPEHAPNHHSA